uniref:Transposase n=1 Tax=Panagrolaimus davidi TaxID=227884 RepID=A0A914NZC4_9BILA
MVLPCLICGNHVDPKQSRRFPKLGTEARSKFCKNMGLPGHIFNHIGTPRIICLQHFGSTTTEDQNGKTVVKYDSLPKALTTAEKDYIFNTPSPSRYRAKSSSSKTNEPKTPPFKITILQPAIAEVSATVSPSFQAQITPLSSIQESFRGGDGDDEPVIRLENTQNLMGPSNVSSPKTEPKYVIVQYDKLVDLTSRCHHCGHRPKYAKHSVKFDGTACKTKLWCSNCEGYVKWESQDRIPGRKIYQGNVEIASAVAAAPIPISSFLQFAMILNLAIFNRSTYYNYIPTFWAVIQDKYDKMQQKVIQYIKDKECKNKRAQKDFQPWCQAFLNHLWYSVTSAKGNGSLCQEFAVSAILHSIGVHDWVEGPMSQVLHENQALVLDVNPDNILKHDPLDLQGKRIHELHFKEHLGCRHDQSNTGGDKALLNPTSASYGVLLKAFTNDGFLTDVERLSPKLATSALEGFHGLVSNIYRPKNQYLNIEAFTNRTKLAVLHYNNNLFDEYDGKRKVIREVSMKAKHRGGDIVKKKVKSKPDFSWKKDIVAEVRLMFEMKLDSILEYDKFDNEENEYVDTDDNDLLENLMLTDVESDEEDENV